MGILDDFFHPERPYEDTQEQLRKFWEEAQKFQQPYANAGTDQIGRLTGAEDRLLHPDELQNEWASKYEMSPYARQMMNENKSSGLDAASSMGMMGSTPAILDIQKGAGDIMQKDRQQYLNDLMQKYMTAINIGQGIFNTGATTAGNLGNQAMQMGQDMGTAQFGASRAPSAMLGNILGNTAGMALNYFTGGMGQGGMGRGAWAGSQQPASMNTWAA